MQNNIDYLVHNLVTYVYDSEFEDFVDWLQSGGASHLFEEFEAQILVRYHTSGDSVLTEAIRGLMQKAAHGHIYASAWLLMIK